MRRPSVLPLAAAARVSQTQGFLLLAICIGLFAGLLVVCFHIAIDAIAWAALRTRQPDAV